MISSHYKIYFIVFLLFSSYFIQGQSMAPTITSDEAFQALKMGTLVVVLPSNESKIINLKKVIAGKGLNKRQVKRLNKMLVEAKKERDLLRLSYLTVSDSLYRFGRVEFIFDTAMVDFQEEASIHHFLPRNERMVSRESLHPPFILLIPSLSEQQSLSVFAFKGYNNEIIKKPFPTYLRRKSALDNIRHLFNRSPIVELEAIRVFNALNKHIKKLDRRNNLVR